MAVLAPNRTDASDIRRRVVESGSRIRRVKATDRAATSFIKLGGAFVIFAVSFIFLFILSEAWPLFRSPQGSYRGSVRLGKAADASGLPPAPLLIGTDEYQRYVYGVFPDARVVFFRMTDGSPAMEFPLASIAGAQVTAVFRTTLHDYLALGTSDGRVSIQQVRFRPVYENQRLSDLEPEVRELGTYEIDPGKSPVKAVACAEQDGRRTIAAVVADDTALVMRADESSVGESAALRTDAGEKIRDLRIGRSGALVASTERGNLYHWELDPEPRRTEITKVSEGPVTAMEYALGEVSLLVGDEKGDLSAWFRVRRGDNDRETAFVRAHTYARQSSAIQAISPSARDKSFVALAADGVLSLHHLTSERNLMSFPGGPSVGAPRLTPRVDGLVVAKNDGSLDRYDISVPHPEISPQALLGKTWYEGYAEPEYVWQSTGGTDDFEPKFSLVPLVFGTIKGTFYAMLFAAPIAILGALYTSQFVHPTLRAKVKPTVEIMAALPSVVVGFIAGLWLASRVEREVVPLMLMIVLLPSFGTAGVLFWSRLPEGVAKRFKSGMELFLIVPLLLLGAWIALAIGPFVESALFLGDFRLWLTSALGLVYDQRNSLVVGLAMGFAVIPIIFTIAEDSFSSVPRSLSAASLALGASRWQTATRVVLPTASPGVFSALMVGFGRAVGETMIVLMATGNTPLLDWSIFNGMRTLSANVAVEIPEAPNGGTLYRTLFLAALVLFAMTFIVNTIAELIRQRLRERYRAI
jgi:phosphate transport system permease protein